MLIKNDGMNKSLCPSGISVENARPSRKNAGARKAMYVYCALFKKRL